MDGVMNTLVGVREEKERGREGETMGKGGQNNELINYSRCVCIHIKRYTLVRNRDKWVGNMALTDSMYGSLALPPPLLSLLIPVLLTPPPPPVLLE